MLAVADGKITQDEANAISTGRALIKAIKDQVKSGDLTREDAKKQIDAVKDSLPDKSEKVGRASPKVTGKLAENQIARAVAKLAEKLVAKVAVKAVAKAMGDGRWAMGDGRK